MSRSRTRYTVVRHSAYTHSQNPQFERGLESAVVETDKQALAIIDAGGVVFSDYVQAEEYAMQQMYPVGVRGLIPHAMGRFLEELQVDGAAVYVPSKVVTV